MARANNLTMCSFCGKSHAEVRKLIAGPGVYICDSCINVCKGILDKELNEDARKNSTTLRVPKPMEIRRQLGQRFAESLTSREILRAVRLSAAGRTSLREIVAAVEWTYFGAYPAASADYAACRRHFETLQQALRGGVAA